MKSISDRLRIELKSFWTIPAFDSNLEKCRIRICTPAGNICGDRSIFSIVDGQIGLLKEFLIGDPKIFGIWVKIKPGQRLCQVT